MKQTRNKADLQQSKPPAKHTPNEVNTQEDIQQSKPLRKQIPRLNRADTQ